MKKKNDKHINFREEKLYFTQTLRRHIALDTQSWKHAPKYSMRKHFVSLNI